MDDDRKQDAGKLSVEQLMERWLEDSRRRQDSIDKRFELQADQITQLSTVVATLTADVRTLVENQKGLFNRANRPTNWQAIIGAITLWGTATWLLMTPIDKELLRVHEFIGDQRVVHRDEAYNQGVRDTDIKWLMDEWRRRNGDSKVE